MRATVLFLMAVGVVALALGGCSSEEPAAPEGAPGAIPSDLPAEVDTEAACACEEGKAGGTVWCPECNVGYVKGEKTECKDCVASATAGKGKCEKCAAG